MKKISKIGFILFAALSASCGNAIKRPLDSKAQIYNGKPDHQNRYLSTVRINISKTNWCSGVLISNRHVLTAAHCFPEMKPLETGDREYPANEVEITVEQASQFGGVQTEKLEVEKVIVSKFRQWMECVKPPADPKIDDCDSLGYIAPMTGLDVAVAILKSRTTALPFDVRPIEFPSYGVFKGLTQPGEEASMAGFGEVWKNDVVVQKFPLLRQQNTGVYVANVPPMPYQAPKELNIEFRAGSALDSDRVTEDKKSVACAGDSGGPVISYYTDDAPPLRPYLMGIASRLHSKLGAYVLDCSEVNSVIYTSSLAAQCWLASTLPSEFSKPYGEGQGYFLCPTIKYEPNDIRFVPYKEPKK